MLEKIKRVKEDWDYLYEDQFGMAKVIFYNKTMNVKSVTLKDIEFESIFEEEITMDKIKKFFKDGIKEKWEIDMNDFKKRYENLVELIFYDDYIIILQFKKEKYYEFFNIKKGYEDIAFEKLLAPYSLKLTLEYTNLEDKTGTAMVKLIFTHYKNDGLILNKFISKELTLNTKPLIIPEYCLIFQNPNEEFISQIICY